MASLPIPTTPNPQISQFKSKKPPETVKFTQTHLTKLCEYKSSPQSEHKSYFHSISSLCKVGELSQAVNLLNEMELKNMKIGPEIYGEILQGCLYERNLFLGQQIHARIVKNGNFFAKNEYVGTKLLIFYAKCDVSDIAVCLFDRLSVHNVFSWAAIIGLNCRMGLNEEAVWGFVKMLENGFFSDNFIIPNALKASGALKRIGFGKGVHGYALKMGFGECVFVASSLVDMYGKCGAVEQARKVFDNMDERNVVSWNSTMVAYVQNGFNEEAIQIFCEMRKDGIELSRVTLASLLSASANLGALEEGKQGHALAVMYDLDLDYILGSSLMNFYSKVALIEEAELVFSRMLERDMVAWNLLISCYVNNGQIENAIQTCRLMRLENLRFDSVTLASILSASADWRDLELGKEGHGYCIRNSLDSNLVVASCIINMYAKCGRIDNAVQVFNSTRERDLVLWNTLLAAYAEVGQSREALKLFYQMQLDGVPPNVVSYNSVILGLLRNGETDEAKNILFEMQSHGIQPNLITWTTLISGLAENGYGTESIMCFQLMQQAGIQPNIVSFVSVLSACKDFTSLEYGTAMHGLAISHGIHLSISIATSLVDMYAKCGAIDQAMKVFDMIQAKELPLYNAMISAYSLHGRAAEALALFESLQKKGIEPDTVTFTNVLSACSHAGLLDKMLELLSDMVSRYQMKPNMEHYGCIVSLLLRSGNLCEALRLVSMMPFAPDAHILGSLLAACREHNEVKLGEYLLKQLFELEPDNSGNFVALSNIYAAAGKWDEVSHLRNNMRVKGLKKNPGCSWIQVEKEVHMFASADVSHPQTREIYLMLALLKREMQ
ncbi:E motif [Dillenia turbinata]|uniref:E motif n=1 Tax=Dillenia turbinata TaxID=194707 RepID=A0AAN8ZKW1_9MAGN